MVGASGDVPNCRCGTPSTGWVGWSNGHGDDEWPACENCWEAQIQDLEDKDFYLRSSGFIPYTRRPYSPPGR